ncbi:hypothetical protein Pmar_PMAR028723, partial [Perkinsus marinus ATCC 50983]
SDDSPILSQAYDLSEPKVDTPSSTEEGTTQATDFDLPYSELYSQGPKDLLVSVDKGPIVLKNGKVIIARRMTMQLPFIGAGRTPPFRLRQLIRRDLALLSRLQQSGHLEIYDGLLDSFKKARYIRPVTTTDVEADLTDSYYMPHFPVFTASKTSPCRPVWCGNELSSYLCRGYISDVEATIISSWMALRTSPFYATTDLSRAFYSLKVKKSDRKYQRFIYRGSAFEFAVVMMGLRPSPAMLMRALRPIASLAMYILTFLFGDPGPQGSAIDPAF